VLLRDRCRSERLGLEVAQALGRGLSAARVSVVSGLALGIDSAAHAGAVQAPGRPIGVLAGSAHIAYPARAGEVILFESWLRHEVPPSPIAQERISISFNYR
jgi:predicted Rossmann fold nucleotide-binding protein DprA/Smf involved in DNA uptake